MKINDVSKNNLKKTDRTFKMMLTAITLLVSANFSNVVAQPTITSFTPSSGYIGSTVTINGTNFNSTAFNNIVYFGATRAIVTTGTTTSLTVTVPVGATYQYISITDITAGLTAYSEQPFVVTFLCGGLINANSFAAKVDFTADFIAARVSISDLDGDGKADLAIANKNANTISLLRNTSTSGMISFATKVDFTTGAGPDIVAIGDIDGDGKPDIAVINKNEHTVSVLRNTSIIGTISFTNLLPLTACTSFRSVAIGDLDGDGKPDLAVANGNCNTISVLRNTSTIGAISFAPKVDLITGSDPNSIVIGDLDGDGKADIAVSSITSASISVLKNTCTSGSISFAPKVDLITGNYPLPLVIGDLDGDGKADLIVVSDNNPTTLSLLKNTSTSGVLSFAPKVDLTGFFPFGLAIGDLDGDGKPDLAVASDSPATVSLLKNTSTSGTISFASKVDFAASGAFPSWIAIGDLDGDGKSDIVLANEDSQNKNVSVLRNLIGTAATVVSATTATICSGSTISIPLTSDIPATYTWLAADNLNTTGESTITQTSSILSDIITNNTTSTQTVIYTVNAIASSTCVGSSQTITVIVNPLPISDAGVNLTICSGIIDSIGATTVLGYTYSWSPATGLSNSTVSNPVNTIVNGTSTPIVTTYTVTTNNIATGCQSTDSAVITVNPQPILVVTNPTAKCFPSTIDLTATAVTAGSTGGGILSYWADAGAANLLSLPNAIAISDTTYIKVTAIGGCTDIKSVSTIVNPLPIVSFTGLDGSYCYNTSAQTLTGSPSGGTFSGNGISGNTFTPSIAGSGIDSITYTYLDSNTCTNSSNQIIAILPLPTAPNICMVTVDNSSNYNIIYWDKTPYTNVDSFIIYRETVSNSYKRIGSVSIDSMSLLIDTVRQLYFPFTGNPNIGTYRYKLQIRDTCGNYSLLSEYHNTIYVTQTGGNFNWNNYQIENHSIPIAELSAYQLLRDDNNTGNWTVISGVSGSQLTINDPNYASYPNAKWRIETSWSISCNPSRSINSTRSNIKTLSVNGIATTNEYPLSISIYPNPYSGSTTITYLLQKKSNVSLEIYSALGQKLETLVKTDQTAGEYKCNFGAKEKGFDSGVYFLKISIDGKVSVRRIVELQ